MRIIFFGTSNVALPVLETLHRHHDIAAVVTTPDAVSGRKKELTVSPVSVLASELDIKIFKPENPKKDDSFKQALEALNADIFVVVSYGKVLPLEVINMPKYKTLNVHFSKLPKYRGASPMQAALLNGDGNIGITIFVLDEKLDNGPIVFSEDFNIDPDDNFLSLSTRLAQESAKLILRVLPDYVSGKLIPTPQDENLATSTKIITRQDGKIDWNKTSKEIYNQFRAYYPWPGIWTTWNGKKLKITDCRTTTTELQNGDTTDTYRSGTILEGGVVVCGNNTFLQISSLQLEGKTETTIADFLNGNNSFIGSRLE